MTIKISKLFLFPVKSLRGIAIDKAELTEMGFKWDRHWMIVKPDGGFITQRQLPQMVLIRTQITADALILSKDGMEDLIISLEPNRSDDPEIIDVKVWKDQCKAIDEGEAASQWITKAIGTPKALRIVRMAAGHKRPQSKADLLGETTHTLFADAAPILICNNASLNALNQSLKAHEINPVPMDNFRPNIVIDGVDAFEEHKLDGLFHEDYTLKHCYPCQRCAVPTIDIDTATRHPKQEPFSLLAALNSMPDNSKAPAFGENTIVQKGLGNTISVGDLLKSW